MSVYQYNVKKKKNIDGKRDNGIRYFFSTTYVDWDKKKKQKKVMGFLTKKECEEGERDFLRSVKRNSQIPFSVLYQKYIEHCVKILNLKKTTLNTKENIFQHHILPYFEDISINEIDKPMINDFFTQISNKSMKSLGKDLSPSYKKTIKTELSGILNFGVSFFGLEENVCRGIKFGENNVVRSKVWGKEDFKKFISTLNDDLMNKTIFTLLWCSGMREGELLGLQLRDFDFEKNTVSVNRNYQTIKGKSIYTTPKTDCSIRTVSLPKVCIDLVDKYYKSLIGVSLTDRLFETSKDNMLNLVKKYCDNNKIEKITIHCFRHSFITEMINSGVSPKTVAQMVGHKNVKTTLNIYTHCNVDNQKTVSNIYEEQLRDLIM